MEKSDIHFRQQVTAGDVQQVRQISESTGFFFDFEVDVAVSLIEERLNQGEASGYHFVFAEQNGRTVGYSCFGPIPCTQGSFDLYWLAVRDECRRHGIGRQLMAESERIIAAMGGRLVFLETASKEQYKPTREFYNRNNYAVEAVLKDFYAPGDDKVIFVKRLAAPSA
jgi:D-alanine-D-alanine ligase